MVNIKKLLRSVVVKSVMAIAPVKWKEHKELSYWKKRKKTEGTLSNNHYKFFYTTHFGIADRFYENKTILDIGCGPRGSLEWAYMASRRIGLDPLAKEYLKLGADQHAMEYIDAPSERIPLQNGECDVVFSFNSLDHVVDVEQTLNEVKRVTRPGGSFLLLVEVNHLPTDCEPHQLHPGFLLDQLCPEFQCKSLKIYKPVQEGIYKSILANKLLTNPDTTKEEGFLSAFFVRKG